MVLLDDIVGDRKPQAGSGVFARNERIEYMRQDFTVDAGTAILHDEQDFPFGGLVLGADRQAAPWLHALDRVQEKVEHNLSQLVG